MEKLVNEVIRNFIKNIEINWIMNNYFLIYHKGIMVKL